MSYKLELLLLVLFMEYLSALIKDKTILKTMFIYLVAK